MRAETQFATEVSPEKIKESMPIKIIDKVINLTNKKVKGVNDKEKLRRRRGQAKCELVIDFNENEFNEQGDVSDSDEEVFDR